MSKTPATLTSDECRLLLDVFDITNGTPAQVRRGIRNRCIALIMLEAGLRVTETISLNISDLWFNSSPVTSVLVRAAIAKNHKERLIPISQKLCEAISQMHEAVWSQTTENGHHKAFTASKLDKPLTRRQVYQIIRAAAKRSIGRSVFPHALRHTFASKLMRVTDMSTVQELLGHKHLSSTQVYMHPNSDDKKKAIEKMDHSDSQ
jgi:integrase/recombinase XerC